MYYVCCITTVTILTGEFVKGSPFQNHLTQCNLVIFYKHSLIEQTVYVFCPYVSLFLVKMSEKITNENKFCQFIQLALIYHVPYFLMMTN